MIYLTSMYYILIMREYNYYRFKRQIFLLIASPNHK